MAPEESSQPFFYVARSGQWRGPFSSWDIASQVADRRIRAKDQMVVAGQQEPFKAGLLLAFPQLTPSYHDWLWCIKNNPQGVDALGAALLFAALPVTLLATLFGLSLFPPGIYPKIVLASPGILVGALSRTCTVS